MRSSAWYLLAALAAIAALAAARDLSVRSVDAAVSVPGAQLAGALDPGLSSPDDNGPGAARENRAAPARGWDGAGEHPASAEAITVRLQTPTGDLLADVELRVYGPAGFALVERSAADGSLRMDPPAYPIEVHPHRPGWELVGRLRGTQLELARPSVILDAHTAELVLVLRERAAVAVTLRDHSSGAPIEHATVEARFEDAGPWSGEILTLAHERRGTYRTLAPAGPDLPDPPFGAVLVTVVAAGYAPIDPLELPWDPDVRGVTARLELEPEPGALRIQGRVLSGGLPVQSVPLSAARLVRGREDQPGGSTFERFWTGTSGADGEFELVRRPASDDELVLVRTERPGSPAWVAGPLPTAEAARAGLRVDAEPWSAIPVIVEGAEPGVAYRAIVDRTVEGAAFELFSRALPRSLEGEPLAVGVGLPALPETPVRLTVGLENRALVPGAWSEEIVWDGSQSTPLRIALRDLHRVRGRVRGLAPERVPGAAVYVQPLGAPEHALFGLLDREGHFDLRGLPPGDYRLRLALGGHPGPGPTLVQRELAVFGDVSDLVLEVPPPESGGD